MMTQTQFHPPLSGRTPGLVRGVYLFLRLIFRACAAVIRIVAGSIAFIARAMIVLLLLMTDMW